MNLNLDVENLTQILKYGNSNERRDAAKKLVKIGTPSIKPLTDLLKFNYGPTRATAAWALGEIGGSNVRIPLKEALDDVDPKVRKRVAEALRKTDVFPVKIFKIALLSPVIFIWTRAFEFIVALILKIKTIKQNIKFKIVDFINLILGKGIYTDSKIFDYYFYYSNQINLDQLTLYSMLPENVYCEKCGVILQKPPFLAYYGSCPKCFHKQNYANEVLHKVIGKLVRIKLRKNSKLHKDYKRWIEIKL